MEAQRLDRWLWCVRLAKTRSGAQRAIEAGKVRINGKRALKPSCLVQESEVVTATLPGKLFVVRVTGAAERRGPATLARGLYEDLTPQTTPAPEHAERQGGPRPTKRDRRRLEALRRFDV